MTANRRRKQETRKRAAELDIPYTEARRQILNEGNTSDDKPADGSQDAEEQY